MRAFLRRGRYLLLATLFLAVALSGAAAAQQATDTNNQSAAPEGQPTITPPGAEEGSRDRAVIRTDGGDQASADQIIVKFEDGVGAATQDSILNQRDLETVEDLDLIDAEVVAVEEDTAEEAVAALNRLPSVEYAELDYVVYPQGYSDEPRFGELWGLDNTGQSILGQAGTLNVDVDALEASATEQGDEDLVVAVIDDGVDFSHPDLAARKWVNSGETPSNGVDDDGNGFVDDVNGFDFYNDNATVHDPLGFHGTHVAGTIAASLDGQGVVGVAPNVKIMALTFLGPNGGFNSDAIEAIAYAKANGAKISNNSWGGGGFSQALKDAIDDSEQLFVASAGNGGGDGVGNNNDTTPSYPASYDSANILSVAAINNQGNLGGFSNFGATSVDISAPGVRILSSIPAFPAWQAVSLSSVGNSGGEAVTSGFGAEEIGTGQTSFFTKAFEAVDRGGQDVVLVDDDRSDLTLPDAGPTISSAIESATGSAPQKIDVTTTNGPNLSQLQGKTVVWATGDAYGSSFNGSNPTSTTLTPTDQQTLADFLNGGGKLVLTGKDALFLIEDSSFVLDTLGLNVLSDATSADLRFITPITTSAFSGATDTAFAGESYNLNSSSFVTNPNFHDLLVPEEPSAVSQGSYNSPATNPTWLYFNGTSMAAPHASGAAALAASANPTLLDDPVALKTLLMDTGKPMSGTTGKTVTGDMIDAKAALDAATPPDAPVINSPANNSFDTDGDITLLGTAEPNSTVEVFDGTTSQGTARAGGDGTWSKPLTGVSEGSHAYTAKATDDAQNTSPASNAVTVIVDTTAPTVVSVSPMNGATDVAKDTDIEATFSEDMDEGSVEAADVVKLVEQGETNAVAASVDYDAGDDTATLDPSADLEAGTTYTATVSTAAEDEAGNALESDETWSFTTAEDDAEEPNTELTLQSRSEEIVHGSSTTLSGGLTDDEGNGLRSKRVVIESRPAGEEQFSRLTTRTTRSNGSFSTSIRPRQNTEYRASFAGDTARDLSASESDIVRVDVAVKVDLTRSRGIVREGASLILSGSVVPGHQGEEVDILIEREGEEVSTQNAQLDGRSRYSLRYVPPATGRYTVVASFEGDEDHAGTESVTRSFRVI